MDTRFKEKLRPFMPPIVLEWRRSWMNRRALCAVLPTPSDRATNGTTRRPEWEAVPDSASIWTAHEGWLHQSIADTQRAKWPSFLASVAPGQPFGWSHEASAGSPAAVGAHNTIITFGYVLGRAALGQKRLSVLDWGGGVGHYYLYARRLLPELALEYVIKDLPPLCAAGRELAPSAIFWSEDAQVFSQTYDLVFASSSVQYNRDFYRTLAQLCEATGRWLFITRSPFIREHDDFVVVQRPSRYGYLTEYAAWFVNRNRFVAFVESKNFTLEREFLLDERPYVANAPEQCTYSGFLFRRH